MCVLFLNGKSMNYLKNIFRREKQDEIFLNDNLIEKKELIKQEYSDLWQDCGDIYYLLDTLKLTYESTQGLITIEKLPQESLRNLMKGKLPLLDKLEIAECITLSVCAVSLQNFESKKRTKAIANAAFLQFFKHSGLQSQAQFQHADLPTDNKADALTRYDFKRGIHISYGLSLKKFITVLINKNANYVKKFGKSSSSVKADNFHIVFTNHELAKFSEILNGNT